MTNARSGRYAMGKTDAADAEAICEAAPRPIMRFVVVKKVEQQSDAL
jgi:transposase